MVENLTSFEQETLLRYFAYTMSQETRAQLRALFPTMYARLTAPTGIPPHLDFPPTAD